VVDALPTTSLIAAARDLRSRLHRRRLPWASDSLGLINGLESGLGLPLVALHRHYGPYPLFRAGQDNHTTLHRQLYALHKGLESHYRALCQRVVDELIGEACYVQAIPTYRFGLPGNRWVGSYHRDSDFGHSAYEINAICALTVAAGSSALHVQREPGLYDFEALELQAGEVILFDHIDRLHGCPRNRSGQCVASIDFRFVPLRFASAAFAAAAASINTQTPLVPGGYFDDAPLAVAA